MVKRLKKRFMLISLLSVFAALIVLVASMNIINYRKSDNYAMYASNIFCFTVPLECAICEINMKMIKIQKFIP